MSNTALITGAANRIGATIAKHLALAGYAVIVHHNKSSADAHKLCEDIKNAGGRAAPIQAELCDTMQRQSLIERAANIFGPLNVLINNASVFEPDSATTIDEALWDKHFDVHAKAPIFLSRDFANQLQAKTKGNIVNIIDERVLHDHPGYFSYNLSKSVLWTATKTLAQSLAPIIRVNAIGPGPTLPHTRQSQEQFERSVGTLPLERAASPNDIAEAVLFLLNTKSMTGQMLALDGGEHLEWRGRGGITPRNPPRPENHE